MKRSIWAIIAAKDESRHIAKVVKLTRPYVNNVLVVDDGSSDSTSDLAKGAGAEVLRHIVNLGKGVAMKTGIEYALSKKATHVVLLDADGQHEPKDIPKFVQALRDYEIVLGSRVKRRQMPFILKFGNNVINGVTNFLYGVKISDSQCGFRAFRAPLYRKIKWKASNYSMESEMIANIGKKRLKYVQIPISTIYGDKYKGTTIVDGVKIVLDMIWWKLSRW